VPERRGALMEIDKTPPTMKLVPGTMSALLAMKRLLCGKGPLMLAIQAWKVILNTYGVRDVSGEGFGSWLIFLTADISMHHRGFWCTAEGEMLSNHGKFKNLLLVIKEAAKKGLTNN
jgi:hypothetical protein